MVTEALHFRGNMATIDKNFEVSCVDVKEKLSYFGSGKDEYLYTLGMKTRENIDIHQVN